MSMNTKETYETWKYLPLHTTPARSGRQVESIFNNASYLSIIPAIHSQLISNTKKQVQIISQKYSKKKDASIWHLSFDKEIFHIK